jgi:midasin
LVTRRPDAFEASASLDAVFDVAASSGRNRRVRKGATEDDLLAAAGSVLVNPDLAVAAGGCLRPAAMHALAHGLDDLLASAAADAATSGAAATNKKRKGASQSREGDDDATPMTSATRHERACAALGALLELLPHVKPIAARYLRATNPPFARVARVAQRVGDTRESAEDDFETVRSKEHVLLVVRACVRLLRAFDLEGAESGANAVSDVSDVSDDGGSDSRGRIRVADTRDGSSPVRSWDLTPLTRLLRHDDAEVRWTVIMVLEHILRLPSDVASRLRGKHAPDCESRHAFVERWNELETEIALEKASAFLDLDGFLVPALGERGDDVGIEKRDSLDSNLEGFDVASNAGLDTGEASLPGLDVPAAPGHARVGGVDVRRRTEGDKPKNSRGGGASGTRWVSRASESERRFLKRGDTESVTARRAFESTTRRGNPMVLTRSARRNVEATALALCQNRPLLLEGPPGCGKSAVLEEVAARTNNDDFVVLHLDAQTDSKSLLGAYVAGVAPGEFAWKPGALTRAVREGRWVVVEDVDQAPFEVLAALVPLLEERTRYIPGRGESVVAAEGFQLFGTVTTGAGRSGGGAAANSRADPLAGLWARVAIEPPRGNEPAAVLIGAHPNLAPLAPRMLETLNLVQRMCGQGGAAAAPGGDAGRLGWDGPNGTGGAAAAAGAPTLATIGSLETPDDAKHSMTETRDAGISGISGVRAHAGRPFTLRDLLRWARRLERLRVPELSLLRKGVSNSENLPPKIRTAAYEEASDVLCGMLPVGEGRTVVLRHVAAIWGVTADAALHRDAARKPSARLCNGAVEIGRATLPRRDDFQDGGGSSPRLSESWTNTGHAMRILESVSCATQCVEPVLLVGETGTGKTALVQRLANLTGVPLTVVNLSNQSESSDFLGGFRPAGARHLCLPLLPRFRNAFDATFDAKANGAFLTRVSRYAERRKWTHLLRAFRVGVERVGALAAEAEREAAAAAAAEEETEETEEETEEETPIPDAKRLKHGEAKSTKTSVVNSARSSGRSRSKPHEPPSGREKTPPLANPNDEPSRRKREASFKKTKTIPFGLLAEWRAFERDLSSAERAVQGSGDGPVFAFVEGALVTALKEGGWILLDEINLAPAETLERLNGVLESAKGSVVLSERGDAEPVVRHPRFRAFGAMNPATDVGKRDLPASLKHRFTEVFVGECEGREDLRLLVSNGLRGVPAAPVDAVVDFYLAARSAAKTALVDSADQKPQYSLRTVSRAMEYVRHAAPMYGLQRALYDGFAMSFQTLLKRESADALEKLLVKHLLRGVALKVGSFRFLYRTRNGFFASRGFFFFFRNAQFLNFSIRVSRFGSREHPTPLLQPAGSSAWTRRGPDWGGKDTTGAQNLFSARRTEKCDLRARARRAAPDISFFSFF